MSKKLFICLCITFLSGCIHNETSVLSAKDQKFAKASRNVSLKAGQSFDIVLSKKENNNDSLIQLVADIMPLVDMPEGQFAWKLPQHAEVLQGLNQGPYIFEAHKKIQMEITVSGLKTSDDVFFHAFEVKKGVRHGTPAMLKMTTSSDSSTKALQKAEEIPSKFKNQKIFQ